jgi:hypothetical protein
VDTSDRARGRDPRTLSYELKGGTGYRDTVHNVHLLAQIYRANWNKIEGKTYFTQGDIRHADALAKRLNDALADRDTRPGALEEVSSIGSACLPCSSSCTIACAAACS